ncbi:MAG: sugar phosphate isomerase/epimerase [Anaerolineae bacterium]|nr:sugar phosphate isomerase/epimerase [Anaerolineae bacterium]
MHMQFGANTFIWTSPFSTDDLGLLPRIKAFGFDLIEIACEDPGLIHLPTLKAALNDAGLGVIVCGAFGPDRDLSSADPAVRERAAAYTRWLIDAASALGSPVISGPAYGAVGKTPAPSDAARRDERSRSAEALRPLAAYAGERGVRFALEPLNRFETDLINTAEQALDYAREVGAPNVGLHLDTFHMHLEEKSVEGAVRLAGERLFHVHACENDRGAPGSGQVRWNELASGLRKVNYQGAVVIESFTPLVTSIARAVCIWRRIAPDQDSIARDGLAFLRKLFDPGAGRLDAPLDSSWSVSRSTLPG